jgi:hypothetical protein
MSYNNKNSYGPPPSGFVVIMGGSKGRPTGPELRACEQGPRWVGPNGFQVFDPRKQLIQPCTSARRDLRTMIKTNDWWYQKGNNSSTSLIHTTGSSLSAVKRRT